MTAHTFRDKMVEEIRRQGVKMSVVSRRSGVNYDIIRDLWHGRSMSTSPENARAIARVLGFSLDDYREPMRSEEAQELLAIYADLPPEWRSRLLSEARIYRQVSDTPAPGPVGRERGSDPDPEQ